MDIDYGSWKFERLIGKGSYGTVCEIVKEGEFGKIYRSALKIMNIPASEDDIDLMYSNGATKENVIEYYDSVAAAICSEVEMMYSLTGVTNIVNYHDHVVRKQANGIGWDILIRMELLTSIPKYLKAGNTFHRQDVIRLGIDICNALERCQRLNIIHRDIKPENILISEAGDFKLADFGIARTVEGTTGEMSTKGSFNYMAPEVFKGKKYGYSIDIYSLGMVMYKLLNNMRSPFFPPYPESIHYSDENNALRRRMNGEAFPFPCNDSTRLGEIVLKACSYDPKDRYSSPAAMRQDLMALLVNSKVEEDLSGDILPESVYSFTHGTERSIKSDTGNDRPAIVIEPEEPEVKEPELEELEVEELEVEEPEPEVEEPKDEEPEFEEPKVEEPEIKELEVEEPEAEDTRIGEQKKQVEKKKGKPILFLLALFLVVGGGIGAMLLHSKPDLVAPEIEGMSLEETDKVLNDMGIETSSVVSDYSDVVPKDAVIGLMQDGKLLEAGAELAEDVSCDLVISIGKKIVLEDYVGKNAKDCVSELEELGLKVVSDTSYSDKYEKDVILKQKPEKGTSLVNGDSIILTVSLGAEPFELESYKKKKLADVKKVLEKAGIVLKTKEKYSDTIKKNYIISQSEEKGSILYSGDTLTLTVSKGVKKVKVPDVTGISEEKAIKKLKDAGLSHGHSDYTYDNDVAAGIVISQDEAVDSLLKHDSPVSLVVSKGKVPTYDSEPVRKESTTPTYTPKKSAQESDDRTGTMKSKDPDDSRTGTMKPKDPDDSRTGTMKPKDPDEG